MRPRLSLSRRACNLVTRVAIQRGRAARLPSRANAIWNRRIAALTCCSLFRSECGRHGIERRSLRVIANRDGEPALAFLEIELEERAALALDGDQLVEGRSVETRAERDKQGVVVPFDCGNARDKPGPTGPLTAKSLLVQRAARHGGLQNNQVVSASFVRFELRGDPLCTYAETSLAVSAPQRHLIELQGDRVLE
jgi:hypothetical protein